MRVPREAAIFVHRKGRYLVMRQTRDGYWNVPAGGARLGEEEFATARRELEEETGLVAKDMLVDLKFPQSHPIGEDLRKYPPGTDQIVLQNFAVEAPPAWEPRLTGEHDEYRWCALDDALALMHWPETREALRTLAVRLASHRHLRID